MLDIVALFIKTNQYKTFHEASVKLNIPLPTLLRRIKKLEDNLSLALFYREKGCLRLTEPGKSFYSHCFIHVEHLQSILCDFKDVSEDKVGIIKLIAPQNFIKSVYFTGVINQFTTLYPNIKIHMMLSDERLDLKKTEFDLAIRIGQLESSQNICKVINQMNFVLACSPNLIEKYGLPTNFEDLAKLPHISCSPFENWSFIATNSEKVIFKPQADFVSNDIEMCALSAIEGRGVYYGPTYCLLPHFKDNSLVKILEHFEPIKRDVNLIWPDKLIPKSTRYLIDFLGLSLSGIEI
ncbi:LysR family transcriptional regulator [Pseudoalteromonas ostreae]|uniref:LysR family transcriptional regulator n=1 Tax=Pseudoalteromonas ostreae TaxID=2774154 RepID=UPI001B385FA9|nr:LysR family transcriptional regulator [Pseudoalteromonas ostreae]